MDPELEARIDAFGSLIDPYHDLDGARLQLRRHLARIPRPGPDVVSAEDRVVPGPRDAPDVGVRILRPVGTPAVGTIVWLPGGGWISGNSDTEHWRATRLCASAGANVVVANYRLAPENPYPAALLDSLAVLDWVATIGDHDLGGSRLAVGGTGAGGNLATGCALHIRDHGGPALALLLLICPMLDDRMRAGSVDQFWEGLLWDGLAATRSWGLYLGEGHEEPPIYAAPGRAASVVGLPPTYIQTTEFDPHRDEGIAFATRMVGAGAPIEVHHFPGVLHNFEMFIYDLPLAQRAMADYGQALAAALRPPPTER